MKLLMFWEDRSVMVGCLIDFVLGCSDLSFQFRSALAACKA